MILQIIKYIRSKLDRFFTHTLVFRYQLLEYGDGILIKEWVIDPFFKRIVFPIGRKLVRIIDFYIYIVKIAFSLSFYPFMNVIGNRIYKYFSIPVTELIVNPMIVTFQFYCEIFYIWEILSVCKFIILFFFTSIRPIIFFIEKNVFKFIITRKYFYWSIRLYRKIKYIKTKTFFYKIINNFYYVWCRLQELARFIINIIKRKIKYIFTIINNATYETRVKIYKRVSSPFRAPFRILYTILVIFLFPIIILKNYILKIVYPPIKLKWLSMLLEKGYVRTATFSREKYLFKFIFLILFISVLFTIANKLFPGGRYKWSQNSGADVLFGNWDPYYAEWPTIFKKQLLIFFCVSIFIYVLIAREYMVQWTLAAEIFMTISIIGLYLMERRYTKYWADWEYRIISNYHQSSKKKRKLFYKLLYPARSFFLGIDNFIKYLFSKLNKNKTKKYTYNKNTSERYRRSINSKTEPRILKWAYGNKYTKKRHITKLFWRIMTGDEPDNYSIVNLPHFNLQTENIYFDKTKYAKRSKRRFRRTSYHFYKKWKYNCIKKPYLYNEVYPSFEVTPPSFKNKRRDFRKFAYTYNHGKVYERQYRYPKRHNLKFYRFKSKFGDLFKLGSRTFHIKFDKIALNKYNIRIIKDIKIPWIYIKNIIHKRTERPFNHSFINVTRQRHRSKKKLHRFRLIKGFWKMRDRRLHKHIKRTKWKRGRGWYGEKKRYFFKKKDKDKYIMFMAKYREKGFMKMYIYGTRFSQSRKKARLSTGGRGLYTRDARYLLSSTLGYWHEAFYYYYLPIWLHNFPASFYELLSYIYHLFFLLF